MNSALRLDGLAGVGEGAVILADVDAVRIHGSGKGRVIVQDKRYASSPAKRDQPAGDALDGGEVVVFRPKLEEVDTAGKEGGGGVFGIFLGHVAEIKDAVKAGME